MYHDVYRSEPLPEVPRSAAMYHVSEATFLEHLGAVEGSGLEVRDARSFAASHKPTAVLTFDDGWLGSLEIAVPHLAERGFGATFFVTKDFVGRPGFADPGTLRRASESGMELGVHGTTHRMLSACSPMEIRQELADCKAYLEDITGHAVTSASLPGGDWTRHIADIAKDVGLSLLFTSRPGLNRAGRSPLALRRIAIREHTEAHDVERFCRLDVGRERARDLIFRLPRRVLGMRRYARWRRRLLGEKDDAPGELFKV